MQTFLVMYAPFLIVILTVIVAFWTGLRDGRIHDE
jgi:choline-glycine betaine transporter